MKKRSIILVSLFTSLLLGYQSLAQDFMINGYIPNYRSLAQYNAVDYDNLDIAFYAFINNNADGSLVSLSAGNLTKLEAMVTNAHAAGKKAYISLGGQFGGGVIFEMANNSTARAAFVQNIVDFMELHDFDGLDIDWEGLENAAQRTAHENLMADLRTALDVDGYGLILTIGFGNYWGQWFSNAAVGYADYLQMMVYDQTGTWSASPFGQHSSYSHAVQSVDYWFGRGVPKSKMILGLPAYGYRFASTAGGSGTAFTYASAVTSDPDLTSADNITADGLGFFNGQDIIIEKTAYAMDEGLAGVFFWEMTQDIQGPRSLHQAAVYQVNGVTLPPLAGFTASTTFVPPSQDVVFTNNSSLGTATTYEWDFGVDANPATASGIGPHTVTYSSSGFKTISLTVEGPGGENTSTRNNYVNVSIAASVFEAAEAGIKVYPNPVSDIFYVDSERVGVESVEVYNTLSTKVIDNQAAGNNKVAIDLSTQPKGVYVLVIKTQGGTYTQRIMKTN